MRTILMIAYFFPPLGGIAVQRAMKFACYLKQFGWHPIILSVEGSPYVLHDPALTAQLPSDLTIFRARTLEPAYLYTLYHRLIHRRQKTKTRNLANEQHQTDTKTSLAARIQSLLFIPDERIGWLPTALALGKQILQREQPDVIFSTSAPYTNHLVAKCLSKWSGLPWVLDLRDPWVNNHFDTPPTRLHRFLTERLERVCVHQAKRVVCVTPLMTKELRERYSDQPTDKFLTITNGFDAADFDPNLTPDPDRFSIRHIGSLYGGRSAIPFLEGLVLALEREPALRDVLQVDFIGIKGRLKQQAWDTFVETHNLLPWVSSQPFVPHHEAIRLMQQSQVQLLISGEGKQIERIYPGKLFEYLGARRPILALSPPGVVADLVNTLAAGLVVSSNDPQKVAQAILKLYSQFQRGELRHWSPKNIEFYERRRLTEKLASVFNSLAVEKNIGIK
jgi:glycosyltransferase involved in cell wall biosynthesis